MAGGELQLSGGTDRPCPPPFSARVQPATSPPGFWSPEGIPPPIRSRHRVGIPHGWASGHREHLPFPPVLPGCPSPKTGRTVGRSDHGQSGSHRESTTCVIPHRLAATASGIGAELVTALRPGGSRGPQVFGHRPGGFRAFPSADVRPLSGRTDLQPARDAPGTGTRDQLGRAGVIGTRPDPGADPAGGKPRPNGRPCVHRQQHHQSAATSARSIGGTSSNRSSAVEAILRQDPQGVHLQMDFRSRDLCRREVEDLSRRSGHEEEAVAAVALRLATERVHRPEIDPREGTVGYFLIGEGRPEIEAEIHYRPDLRQRMRRRLHRRALRVYLLAIGVLTALICAAVFWVVGPGPHGCVACLRGHRGHPGRVTVGSIAGELVREPAGAPAKPATAGLFQRHSPSPSHGGHRPGVPFFSRNRGEAAGTLGDPVSR